MIRDILKRSALNLIVSALALVLLSCAPSHDLAFPTNMEGGIGPSRSLSLGAGIARAQTFVADAEEFFALQILIARDEVRDDVDVVVEVRNVEFDRRYGTGRIEPFKGEPFIPEWRTVKWSNAPHMVPGEKYALVVTTDEYTDSWILPVADRSTYPLGDLQTGPAGYGQKHGVDLGFRAVFGDGTRLESELVATGRVPAASRRDPPSPYGDIVYVEGARFGVASMTLPVCRGGHCVDYTENLGGSPAERARLGANTFRRCDNDTIDVFKMEIPAIGLSCRDVCRGERDNGCVGARESRTCEAATEDRSRLYSCDKVVSSIGEPEEVFCLCADEDVHHNALADPKAIEAMVQKNYRVDERGSVSLRANAVPSGVTCAQVCCELSNTKCGEMTRLVTPLRPDCGTCRVEPKPAFSLGPSAVAAGKIVTRHQGKVWLIDPASARIVATFEGIPEDLSAEAAGNFVYWLEPGRGVRDMWVLDVDEAKLHTFVVPRRRYMPCKPAGGEHLVSACRGANTYVLRRLIPPGEVLNTPEIPKGEVVSFDGKTLIVETRGDRWRWTVGEDAAAPVALPTNLRPRWATGLVLDALFEASPDHHGFVGSTFFASDADGLWSYTPGTRIFRRWPRTETRAASTSFEDGLVRIRGHVLDQTTLELKRLRFEPEVWAGRRAIIRTTSCTAAMSCAQLPEPFVGYSVLLIEPTKLSDYRAIKPVIVEIPPLTR